MPAPPEGTCTAAGRDALVRLVRDEGARVLATLARTTGSLELAEDAVQDVVVKALDAWSRSGIPPEPRAWLTRAARNRAIDLLRREAKRGTKEADAELLRSGADAPLPSPEVVADDLLRLMFTCCHPALGLEAQTALALRTLCGLTTAEVARALLVPEATMAKRLTRARRKIAVAGIPYRSPPPAELPSRLRAVLATVYLLFNEGYNATGGDDPIRAQLTDDAIRLSRLLCELLPDEASTTGLLALLLLQGSRHAARVDDRGDLVLLADQDRARWDRAAIAEGMILLGIALRRTPSRPDLYATQASIAACHALAATWEDTNWDAIVSWYDVLLTITDTPVVRLNRAVAIAERDGPQRGLALLDEVGPLPGYAPLEAARGELLFRLDRFEQAAEAFRRALTLPNNSAHWRHVTRRLDLCESSERCRGAVPGSTGIGPGRPLPPP